MTAVASAIATSAVLDLELVRQVVRSVVGCRQYELPQADLHIVPISGGVDSSATALVLKALHPEQQFLYVFTDTGVETAGTTEAIDRIEQATGQPVVRLSAGQTLFDIIREFGSFLPSARVRYCTRMTKIKPYQDFIKGLLEAGEGDTAPSIATYVGIRADEPGRSAADYGSDSETHFPLRALGLDKRDVFQIVSATIGIPMFYLGRSRSGCSVCVFSRRSEIIEQWRRDPETVAEAAALEALPAAAQAQLLDLPAPVAQQVGVGRNHLSYPMPGGIFEREVLPWERVRDVKAKADRMTGDLFGTGDQVRLFAAVEYQRYWDGFQWQQAFQKLVTYSTSLGGLKTALKFHWKHRIETREAMGCDTEASLQDEIHIGLFEIVVNDGSLSDIDIETGYTWQSDGTPLLQIRKVVATLENILLGEELARLRKPGTQLKSWDADLLGAIGEAPVVTGGEVVWCGMFERPSEASLVEDIDITEAPEPCISCSR